MKLLVVLILPLLMLIPVASGYQDTGTTPKKELKTFRAPELRVINPIVASDEGCVRDFVKALKMDGLEQRKYVSDLFRYGCIERLDGSYLINILGLSQLNDGVGGKVEVQHVHLISNKTTKTTDGWILARELVEFGPITKRRSTPRARN